MGKRIWAYLRANGSRLYFGGSLLAAAFAYGVAVGLYEIPPYRTIVEGRDAAVDWVENWRHYTRTEPTKHLAAARDDGAGVTVHRRGAVAPGVTFISSFWNGSNAMRLIDLDGNTLHEWAVSQTRIWPGRTAGRGEPAHDWDTDIHGAVLLPDGDVVFSFEYRGLARVDRCGRTIWSIPRNTHHSVHVAADGTLWVPGRRKLKRPQPQLPFLEPPVRDDLILEISPDGEVLREISVLEAIYRGKYEAILFADRTNRLEHAPDPPWGEELVHLNDIEPLDAALAGQFPLFEAGDLLISMRYINAIAVIDPDAEAVKWALVGPHIRQHDPDFLPDGRIGVFDNRHRLIGGSRILAIDPAGGRHEVLYETPDGSERQFHTWIRGKQQFLPNGNILITEHSAGRVFEVTPTGETVWTFINRWDDRRIVKITQAHRYPAPYAEFAQNGVTCDEPNERGDGG